MLFIRSGEFVNLTTRSLYALITAPPPAATTSSCGAAGLEKQCLSACSQPGSVPPARTALLTRWVFLSLGPVGVPVWSLPLLELIQGSIMSPPCLVTWCFSEEGKRGQLVELRLLGQQIWPQMWEQEGQGREQLAVGKNHEVPASPAGVEIAGLWW